jgi:hypothetical protein
VGGLLRRPRGDRDGGADERAFLDEQAKSAKDRGVRKACADASAAITKRLAKP